MMRKANVLVIDEEPIVCASVKAALEAVGHSVTAAGSEAEAMKALREPFDMVFVHRGLPNSTCDEIVRAAREHGNVAIILMSSESPEQTEKNKLRLGADEIVYKPLDPLELRAIVEMRLKQEKVPMEVPGSPRILVVDDEEIVVRSVIDILKRRFEVTGTESPEEALRILKDTPYEILLADLMMEEMYGMDLIRAARNMRPSIGAIVMTGYASKDAAVEALKEGAYDFLEKPFTPEIVTQTVVRAWKALRTEQENRRLLAELRQANEELRVEIEERERAEEDLRQTRDYLENLIDYANAPIIVWDPEFRITRFNHAFKRLIQKGADEVLGAPLDILFSEDRREEAMAHIRRTMTGERWEAVEIPILRADGAVRIVLWNSAAIFAEDGTTVIATIAQGQDITGRKRAEEELKHTTEQLSVLLESLPIVPFTCKAKDDLGITYVAGTIEEVTGYTPDKFIEEPKFWVDHIHPDDLEGVLAELPALFEHEKYHCEYRFRIADGSYKWIGDRRRLVRLPGGKISHIVGTWRDISEEKRLSRESEYRLQQVVQADKLASLGEMVAGVAHELNNPNSFITYNIPLLEETWQIFNPIIADYAAAHPQWRKGNMTINELCRDMDEIIGAIKTGSERISKVVDNLKNFARLDESTHAKLVQVNDVIENTLTIVGGQIRKHVGRIDVDLGNNLPQVHGHFQKLEQVAANLMLNAACAIPDRDRGRISVTTRYIDRLNSVSIQVEDNGTGMEPGAVKRIFEPFFTTRRNAGGTGLGLSVSYGLIRDHNGIIAVLSRPGIGSRFTVIVPVDRRDARLDLRPSILWADDDVGFLNELKTEFEAGNEFFETTCDPESVMAYLEQHPEADIVVSKIGMPAITVWELLEKIKERFPLLTVILYSEHPDALKQKPAGTPEPDHLLQKPFKMNRLFEIINTTGRQRV
ncbi:MAG: response regulator [Desulfobacterales bacterium]|nr:response regulator [Desulfobacterales bacterium]